MFFLPSTFDGIEICIFLPTTFDGIQIETTTENQRPVSLINQFKIKLNKHWASLMYDIPTAYPIRFCLSLG